MEAHSTYSQKWVLFVECNDLPLLGEQVVRAKERIEMELKNEEPISKENEEPISKDTTKSDV